MLNNILRFRETLVVTKLPSLLNAINSIRQLILWFLIYGGLAFATANLIDWFRGVSAPGVNIGSVLLGVAIAGMAEEAFFRGIFKVGLGNTGLVIGTLIWIGLHQLNANPPPLQRIPTDMLLGVFYIKLWRGKYFWLSFIIHPLWNLAIILFWQFFAIS